MAVVRAPLMSLDASGNVGKSITFSHWKGRNVLRKRVIPANPKSGAQVGMRSGLRANSKKFGSLTATQKGNWKNLAKTTKITPLNAMIKFNQVRVRQNRGMVTDPTNAAGAVEAAPTVPVAAAQPKSILLTWVDSAGANDWCTFIYMSATGVVTPDITNCVQIVLRGVQQFVVVKLITGTTYHFQLKGCETGGTIGTGTADFTGTPT